MSGFFQALPKVLEAEGGLVDDPVDRGGLTNHGITQKTYDAWRDSSHEPRRSVSMIDPTEVVQAIYHQRYWIPAYCEALPWPVSHLQFDAAVNHGPTGAVRLLQRALDVDDDGDFGPITARAADAADPDELMDRLLWFRLQYYADIVASDPSQKRFLFGWLNRVLRLWREHVR